MYSAKKKFPLTKGIFEQFQHVQLKRPAPHKKEKVHQVASQIG